MLFESGSSRPRQPDGAVPDRPPSEDALTDPPIPRRIGPYRITQLLGEGGLGVVYLAEQPPPMSKRVALKVLRSELNTPEVAARFRREVRVLATLTHPNIAAALDTGVTDDGRPYCVMEYVPGVPITDYCDRNRLTIQQRLALFTHVCAGIHHAHQKAIIHRDIKSANVLVSPTDGQPVPKVIDFGIVKALAAGANSPEQPMVTQHGDLLGTPEYMSPEQADMGGLPLDTRSDIYSLGTLLYELLVGALPFESDVLRNAGRDGLQRILRENDPPPLVRRLDQLAGRAHDVANRRRTTAVALRRALRDEPQWIVARAMDKDPARRYASASELATDIQRFLNYEPVAAGPASSWYRARTFVRRRRGVVLAATAAVIAVLVGVFEISTGLILQRRARIEAQADVRRANAVLEHVLASIPRAGPADAATVAGVLDAAAASLDGAFSGEPLVEASAHTTLGRLYHALGDRNAAETHLRRALVLRRASAGAHAAQTLESMGHLGALLTDDGQLDEADLLLSEALRLSEDRLGKNHLITISAGANLGRLRARQGRHDETVVLSGEALRAAAASDADPRQVALLRREYGRSLMALQRYGDAEKELLQSFGDLKGLLGADHDETRRAGALLGSLYERWGKPEKGAEYASPLQRDPTL